MNCYRVARIKIKDNRWRPPDQTEHVITVYAERMEQQGGMLDFYAGDELIASFHAQRWICATRVNVEG
jgi:hypothetical protein